MKDGLNRRQFLDGAAASSAAAGYVVTCGTALAQESPSDKIVVGVMGLSRGRSLAARFSGQSNVDVKYVCDVDSNR
ncbi:MAG: gfo/Idh/MocA family oxidoreductase, partial [Planctomycetaceae bacterium]